MKGNVIQMNTLHLNSVRLNGIGKVQSVSLKGGSTEDPVFPPVEPPVEPEPTPTYTLSASVTNGKVSATRNGSAVTLPFTANEGDTIVLEVTPNEGYAFEGWNDGNTDNPRTITMTADKVLSAQCVEVVQPSKYIQFEDAEVERVLMSKGVSSDGVGITYEDAAAVTSISTWFYGNTTIRSFNELRYFPITSLSANAFRNCSNLTALSADWTKIAVIGNDALANTQLSYDTLQLYCTSLGLNALAGVSIKKLILENLATLPRPSVRYECYGATEDLEEIVFKKEVAVIPSYSFQDYKNLRNIALDFSRVGEIGSYAFENTASLAMALNLAGLTKLSAGAFYKSGITEVVFGNGITSIPSSNYGTFQHCTSLRKVVFSESITEIGSMAFNGCSVLGEIDLPASIASIGGSSFEGCSLCSRIICRASVPPPLANNWVFNATNNCPIYVPDASLEAYRTATNWNTYADRIHPLSEIEGGHITTFEGLIGAYTFEGRSNEDADRDIVEDKSGYNNTLTLKSMQWGFIHNNIPDLLREGFWDDALWLSQCGYGEITLPNGLTDFTIIAKRFFGFDATAGSKWSPLVGTGKSSGKGLFWLEYNAGDSKYTNQVNGLKYTLPSLESEVTWLTNTHYNGHRLIGTQGNDVHDGMVYINKFRGDVNVVRFQKIYAVYLFNRQLSPSEIEAFIKEKIDASYVLPTIEQ